MKSMIQQKRQYPIDFNNSPCDVPCNMNTEVGFTFHSDQNFSANRKTTNCTIPSDEKIID